MTHPTAGTSASLSEYEILMVAAEVYDKKGDLEPHEQAFLLAQHRITMEAVRTIGDAKLYWGDGSRAFCAVAYLANSKRHSDLQRAHRDFEAARERFLETT